MKRIVLFLFAFSLLSELKASDTLTIRQIYNFEVGDSFEYYGYDILPWDTSPGMYFSTNIIGKAVMPDTIMYIFTQTNSGIDTVWVTHLDSDAINSSFSLYFSACRSCNYGGGLLPFINVALGDTNNESILIVADSFTPNLCHEYIPNWDSASNFVTQSGTFFIFAKFQNGLGVTYSESGTYNPTDGFDGGYVQLICYSRGSSHACTSPCYPLGINDLANLSEAKVYPNPTTGQLHLSLSNTREGTTQLFITDILGQQVYSMPVTKDESSYDISMLTTGMYTWRLVADNGVISMGKVIKE